MARGFASLSAKRHKELSSKGGKIAALKGKRHSYDSVTAKLNGAKGLQKRLEMLGKEAAVRLVAKYGFNPDDLNSLGLTAKEYVYYGGRTSKDYRRKELQDRIDAAKV